MSRKSREARLLEGDDKALRELLQEWVKELGLTSWDIDAEFVSKDEFPGGMQMAQVDMDEHDEVARIRVVYPDDLVEHGDYPGVEHVLVHELMHVIYRDVESFIPNTSDVFVSLSERAINKLARSFVSLKQRLRRGK